jgi:voltage-gated potassium channel
MTALAFVWLLLVIADLTTGLGTAAETASNAIWVLFILHFVLEFWIAPAKLRYLRRNWLTVIALVLPAFRALRALRGLRVLRFWRVASAARPLSLLRLITSLNRGMRALESTLGRAKVGYAVALTLIVSFAAAAGMYAFENPRALADAGFPGSTGLTSYGEAVWWTAMMLTTMGTDYWPQTTEGRLLSWLLAVYAFAIFGYLTATVATLLLPGGLASQPANSGLQPQEVASLRQEIAALRQALNDRREVSFRSPQSLQ